MVIKIKISTKGKYGLEAILDLAIHASEGPVNLKSIAERQGISDKYLEQLFIKLKHNEIVEGIRGAQGGYILKKEAEDLTVKNVLDVLEGPLALVPCILENQKKVCSEYEGCVTKIVWKRIMDELNSVASTITIADLIACYRNLNTGQEIEYYI